MMPFLTAAVIFVGLLCTLDLILTLGAVKRLREHTELLAERPSRSRIKPSLTVGEEVGDFRAIARNGTELTPDQLPDGTVVAFFSPHCEPCREKLPDFAQAARTVAGGAQKVVAVVVGDEPEARSFVDVLEPVANVVIEEPDGALSTAFQARAFPTVLQVGHDRRGRLVVTSEEPALSAGSPAAARPLS
ncbi:TlpA family protein disulfide reductase [Streptomyces sp. NPDC047725]|uniref:TlpA family protein disulfide reductase n=1 Tax=Streptomyces sp. NPDC047725 TaxID=3365487 RepID=UPI0037223079